jgi:hypothetical protein
MPIGKPAFRPADIHYRDSSLQKGCAMPIPWLVVLQSVPWTDVIKNAPKVADGAKKLWNTIGKKTPVPETEAANTPATMSSEVNDISALQMQLAAVEASVADLHEQMLASSELIKSLAEQNTQLIERVELHRVRVIWLTGLTVIFGMVAISVLILALIR